MLVNVLRSLQKTLSRRVNILIEKEDIVPLVVYILITEQLQIPINVIYKVTYLDCFFSKSEWNSTSLLCSATADNYCNYIYVK